MGALKHWKRDHPPQFLEPVKEDSHFHSGEKDNGMQKLVIRLRGIIRRHSLQAVDHKVNIQVDDQSDPKIEEAIGTSI
mgnify:CR=1 FL=1